MLYFTQEKYYRFNAWKQKGTVSAPYFFAGYRHWMPPRKRWHCADRSVSMPSWAWVVTYTLPYSPPPIRFQCPHGLELLPLVHFATRKSLYVSMPSWAWVVTARMSNILNFSWYFLCIPAIYRCILAYLPIFFNQLSKFLRCESPSTFLGTCLSHYSFIIFLVTNTNTLLSGLYLISTKIEYNGNVFVANLCQCPLGLIPHFYGTPSKT